MWIPAFKKPNDKNMVIVMEYTAKLYGEAQALTDLLELVTKNYPELPDFVNVYTELAEGKGLHIDPILAYHANNSGLLSDQKHLDSHGHGLTGYSQVYYWRELDVKKLRQQANPYR